MSLYDSLYRRVVFPVSQRRAGRRVNQALQRLTGQLQGSADEIRSRQAAALSETVQHARQCSPFWKQRFAESGIDPDRVQTIGDLHSLPLLTKDEVREQLEAISDSGQATSRLAARTGGSTAAPMLFYRDRACHDFREAVRDDYWIRTGIPRHARWANVWGAMSDLGNWSGIRSRWRNRLLRRVLMIPANQLDDRSIQGFAAELNRFCPRLLHGYSQALLLFARLMKQHNLALPDSLVAVTATAEPLHDDQKTGLQDTCGVPVYRVYGTREFGFLAGELPGHQGLMINPLNALVEIVDAAGQPVQANQPGQIVVTDLRNRATPLIRYRIGDIGSWNDALGNTDLPGWSSLNIEAGRETDFVMTPEGRLVGGAGLTLIGTAGFSQLQYVQQQPGRLTVNYVANHRTQEADFETLRRQLAEIVGDLEIEFQQCDRILPLASGKFQFVYSPVSRQAFATGTGPVGPAIQ